jgi:hypothetical protein
VCDGLESLAIHPSGELAVIACLDMFGPTTTSHLAVIKLEEDSAQLLYHLPVERIPEGIEFTSDGTKLLWVQLQQITSQSLTSKAYG